MRRRLVLAVAALAAVGTFAVPVAETSAACSVSSYLTQGKRGSEQVRCLQQSLNAKGFNSGPVDGWFGPVTRGAVVAYQSANGLVVDGVVGPQTAGALGVWSAPQRSQRQQRSQAPTARTTAQRSSGGTTGASGVNWDRVAQCESGGNWGYGQVTNSSGTFSGGLMIWNKAWTQFGGGEFAPTAGQATKEQQIIVAERIAAQVGAARAWQCPVG